jgi:hypothetical protein
MGLHRVTTCAVASSRIRFVNGLIGLARGDSFITQYTIMEQQDMYILELLCYAPAEAPCTFIRGSTSIWSNIFGLPRQRSHPPVDIG